ncbi:unnamed protein product [Zymoseptoria tritici ST99CH_3D7]|uniref:60S ribosomal protein L21 n=1 Tax=Zymoseptoria tritici (strain ST99CH_3D7) TaxID=1276538 RepID=A0A1X7S9B0_ZYMT9|nr:unnamed protein product [Zymoseptoria tritici ST99CH_3D7]
MRHRSCPPELPTPSGLQNFKLCQSTSCATNKTFLTDPPRNLPPSQWVTPQVSALALAMPSLATSRRRKGMPYKVYHGKTGVVYNVTKSAVGVILYRQVGNRYIEKRINVRVEHVRHSRSRDEFLARVKTNAAAKRTAKETGERVYLKRLPAQPREARTVSAKDNKPENVAPIAYETTI